MKRKSGEKTTEKKRKGQCKWVRVYLKLKAMSRWERYEFMLFPPLPPFLPPAEIDQERDGERDQDCLSLFLGRPNGGHWAEARARKASATKCGWDWIIAFQPGVSIMSAAWLWHKEHKDIRVLTPHTVRTHGAIKSNAQQRSDERERERDSD